MTQDNAYRPFIRITSSFDDCLQIEVTDQAKRLGSEHPVYMWRIVRWQPKLEKGSRRIFKYYTLKDLFLIEDLIDEAKNKLKFLYKPMFERSAKLIARGRQEEHMRLAPYIWAAGLQETESADDTETTEDMPWLKKDPK